jgi:hypothetical protein
MPNCHAVDRKRWAQPSNASALWATVVGRKSEMRLPNLDKREVQPSLRDSISSFSHRL